MSTGIHDKIRSELERRLAIARAAEAGARSPWSGDYEGIRDADAQAVFVGPWGYLNDEALAHALLHTPADAIRRYSHALAILDRHPLCADDACAGGDCHRCVEFAPCEPIRDLATSLGLETTDG